MGSIMTMDVKRDGISRAASALIFPPMISYSLSQFVNLREKLKIYDDVPLNEWHIVMSMRSVKPDNCRHDVVEPDTFGRRVGRSLFAEWEVERSGRYRVRKFRKSRVLSFQSTVSKKSDRHLKGSHWKLSDITFRASPD